MICPDCNSKVFIPVNVEEGEIVECLCCGLEFEYRNGELYEIVIEGEDWGE